MAVIFWQFEKTLENVVTLILYRNRSVGIAVKAILEQLAKVPANVVANVQVSNRLEGMATREGIALNVLAKVSASVF